MTRWRRKGWSFSRTRFNIARASIARRLISTRSASIRATSSRSLTSSVRRSVDFSTMSTNSRCRADIPSGERCSSSTKPLIDVRGLRSSCEAVATNSLLARSSRARSVVSRTVHTIAGGSSGSLAAVTARLRPPCSTIISADSAASSGGRGLSSESTRPPTVSSGTSRAALGLAAAITEEPASVTIRASPRLSIVTSRRWRCSSICRCATSRSSPIALKAAPSSRSSRGPDGFTRRSSSPPASARVASTSSSSGRRSDRTSSETSASAAISARTPAIATSTTARLESDRARLRAAA